MFNFETSSSSFLKIPHIACGCRRHITACGGFIAQAAFETDIEVPEFPTAEFCQECQYMWNQIGCGVCGCIRGIMCKRCEENRQLAAS